MFVMGREWGVHQRLFVILTLESSIPHSRAMSNSIWQGTSTKGRGEAIKELQADKKYFLDATFLLT